MTRIKTAKSHAAEPAVLVFGLVDDVPRAAWFAERDVQRLAPTSLAAGCHVVPVDDGHKARVAAVPRGHIGRHGRVDLPAIDRPLYDEVQHAFSPEPGAACDAHDGAASDLSSGSIAPAPTSMVSTSAPAQCDSLDAVHALAQREPSPKSLGAGRNTPVPIQRPGDWDEISVGSLVLAYDPTSEAWYEAIVLMPHGDRWLLRWRDYPEEGNVARGRPEIALMDPTA